LFSNFVDCLLYFHVHSNTCTERIFYLTDKQVTQEQILELLPWVSEANAISEELNKYRSFDVVVLSPSNCKEAK